MKRRWTIRAYPLDGPTGGLTDFSQGLADAINLDPCVFWWRSSAIGLARFHTDTMHLPVRIEVIRRDDA